MANANKEKQNHNPDVIILGVGTSGEDLSHQLLDAGLEVVGIEPHLVGGSCPYYACLPSKTMLRAAKTLHEAELVEEKAGEADVDPDWSPVAERVQWITGGWDDSYAMKRYKKHGGHLIKAPGQLTGPRTVAVNGETYTAKRGIVIATGSKPAIPPIDGIASVDYWTTRDVIQMSELPESIVVVGGGASGCELGQVMARFGVDVTIVEAQDQLLPVEEPEAAQVVEDAFKEEGIRVKTGTRATKVVSKNGGVTVILDNGDELEAEKLFLAAGRTIDLSGLGLESIGIDPDAPFIPVDERMHVTDGVWAMGDVTGKALFSHVGLYQSEIIASEITGKDHPPAAYHAIPRGTFTDPEVGSVGMTEAEARAAGKDPAVVIKSIKGTFRGMVDNVEHGMIKLVADPDRGTLIGASVAGPRAAEMLGMLNLAVHNQIPIKDLQTMMYAFPAFYSAIGEAIGAYGRGLQIAIDPEYQGIEVLDKAA